MNKIQIPWEERPVGCTDVMWRYRKIRSSDAIIFLHPIVFSIVLSYLSKMGFAGVFRCDTKLYR